MTALIVSLLIAGTLGYGLRSGRNSKGIIHRPYNNRYNDASGAREDSYR